MANLKSFTKAENNRIQALREKAKAYANREKQADLEKYMAPNETKVLPKGNMDSAARPAPKKLPKSKPARKSSTNNSSTKMMGKTGNEPLRESNVNFRAMEDGGEAKSTNKKTGATRGAGDDAEYMRKAAKHNKYEGGGVVRGMGKACSAAPRKVKVR